MKRKCLNLMTVLIASLLFVLPTLAADRDHVEDYAGLLTAEERQGLEQQAQSYLDQYGVGVYIATVDDYFDYTNGNIYDAADYFYQDREENGLLLLLSMADREYVILAYGDYAQYAFNDAGLDAMEDYFLDDFGFDAWYDGLAEYISWSGDYLEQAENGTPYSADNIPMTGSQRTTAILIRVAIIFLLPLIIAGVYTLILSARMISVAAAVEASAYASGNLDLIRNEDIYTHTTTTRRKIEKESSSGSSSGGGSGRSGNF